MRSFWWYSFYKRLQPYTRFFIWIFEFHCVAFSADYDPKIIEQFETQQPTCLPLSYVLKFFADQTTEESNDSNTSKLKQTLLSPKSTHSNGNFNVHAAGINFLYRMQLWRDGVRARILKMSWFRFIARNKVRHVSNIVYFLYQSCKCKLQQQQIFQLFYFWPCDLNFDVF